MLVAWPKIGHLCRGCLPRGSIHARPDDANNRLIQILQSFLLGLTLAGAARQIQAESDEAAIDFILFDEHLKLQLVVN